MLLHSCWLRPNPFYGAFLGPACLIIIIDLIIFLRLFNLIKRTYDTDAIAQSGSEAEAETAAEENTLVIQPDPLPSGEGNSECLDKSSLPDRAEMMDLLRGNCVILLVFIVNIALGILLVGYQQSLAVYITVSCLFAIALVILGGLIFIVHCYRKEKIRLLWNKRCCKCRCFTGKKYEIQEESADTAEECPAGNTTADTANGEAGQFSGEEIHGAKNLLSLGDGDSLSNVSLPSSAAITLDKKVAVSLPEKEAEAEAQTEKASSVSDKQSWASAPLPLQYKPRGKLLKKPPGYRHSYTETARQTPTITECRRAPLAPPEGTASSIDSSVQLPTDTASNIAPSEGPSSVREAVEPLNVSRNTNTSCSASEVSIPIDFPPKMRPPIPGSSSHGSDGAPPIPFKKSRPPVPAAVPRPGAATQDLVAHYSTAEATTNSLPRQIPREIPRDHVVVRERYHIPYEPRAVSEKPRDHYQILPLPTSRRDHCLLQPGHDQYQDSRDQHIGPNLHNQYQISPKHYPIPADQNPVQRTYDLNQIPSPTQTRPYDYYNIPRDVTPTQRAHDLYQMARDLATPRSYDSYQAPPESSPAQGTHEHSPGQRSHELAQLSPDHTHMSHDPSPRSPDHSHVSHDSSIGQRSHDHFQVPRDHVARDQRVTERPYENIPVPSDQSSVQRSHERNTMAAHDNELSRDPSHDPRDQNVANDTVHGPTQEGVERPHDQYAGDGPREAVNPGEKPTAADIKPGVPLDKNGVRAQNVPRGSREQPKGVHVPRRRSRNPYQIARTIHQNLGIETRSFDGQTRRSNRVPGEQRSQQPKTYGKALVSSPVETPKERTPRSSMSSWKEERPKPAQREGVSDQPTSPVFVALPHLKRATPEPPRNETSV